MLLRAVAESKKECFIASSVAYSGALPPGTLDRELDTMFCIVPSVSLLALTQIVFGTRVSPEAVDLRP